MHVTFTIVFNLPSFVNFHFLYNIYIRIFGLFGIVSPKISKKNKAPL